MANYLITGGAGFIGSHLCEALLKEGHHIINVDSFTDYYSYQSKVKNVLESLGMAKDFTFTNKADDLQQLQIKVNREQYRLELVDIRSMEGLESIFQASKIDAVIHLAASPGVRASMENPLGFEEVNVKGTLHILELMKKYEVKKWICASSSSVYGNNTKLPFAETDEVNSPISLYAMTKKSCELMGYAYHHLYGIDTIMLRFFTVFGERQRPDLAIHKFTALIDQGVAIPFYGDGSTQRDYTYIKDIINGISGSLQYIQQHQDVYQILNLGSNQTYSLTSLVDHISRELGKKPILHKLPMQPGDVDKTYADISKAQSLIHYNPLTTFDEGLHAFIAWYEGGRDEW
ncbi:NAD-dependent epimerase/dehydratase family protein [Paenibacillus psychroresistens]|uniref:NAD-dependent epimerase/dehydratase family protein n=1 Tax=Paenibacillus psychroresistens TaxID=1778678 RepID=A0A6B8RDQ3_9BACL|nr:GDP-mannose 4,6-dehydratase [Paenibacillus psychroresistens]QGQ94047.1 NAD-dependent epimerase/dehydratase family protein [Paenibacillus psychroresistens]